MCISLLESDSRNTSLLYAATTPAQSGQEYGDLYRSQDGGQNWQPIHQGLSLTKIQSLVLDPSEPGTLYAGSTGDGLFVSRNRGDSWSLVATGLISPTRLRYPTIRPSNRVMPSLEKGRPDKMNKL
jgi:hypothetical protein